ncbi:adenylate/guanylate cyclase domain-containing protein, partial [Allokutzneria sp. NRRL B-24872]|uniref:adenylate/guanylate cyclase domain-containing protein n=1 Tax=Allokutzneria sp. NRRL B-24872 TaxID=1137961 RepID=UPI001178BE23
MAVEVPATHAVLAVDVVSSTQVADDQLDGMKTDLDEHLDRALRAVGLDRAAAVQPRHTGDGVLLAYAEDAAPKLVEMLFHLDHLLRWRNREHRIPLRARMAVHCGPMREEGHYHRPYIVASRLLDAPAFRAAVAQCMATDPCGDKVGAALVVSRWVWHNVVEPFRIMQVPPARCAPVPIDSSTYQDLAWIHLPGMDADHVLAQVHFQAQLQSRPPHPD